MNKQISKYSSESEGESLMASAGIHSRISLFISQPRQAVYLSFISVIGYNYGAKLMDRVKKIYKFSFFFIFGLVSILCAVMYVFAPNIVSLFTKSSDLQIVATKTFRMTLYGHSLIGPFNLACAVLQLHKKNTSAILLQTFRIGLCVVLELFIPKCFDI